MGNKFRWEEDSMGKLKVPAKALYRAQTQRAVENFPVSGRPMSADFICALALVKRCAAETNMELGLLNKKIGGAIVKAAREVSEGQHLEDFPVDVFQTGSGTSSNMNMNDSTGNAGRREINNAHQPQRPCQYGAIQQRCDTNRHSCFGGVKTATAIVTGLGLFS